MIASLIITLGLIVSATAQPEVDCNSYDSNGCYNLDTKEIFLTDNADNNTVIHEVGHALLFGDKIAQSLARSHGLKHKEIYTTYILRGYDPIEEIMANLFVEYINDPSKMSVERPCLFLYLNKLIENK